MGLNFSLVSHWLYCLMQFIYYLWTFRFLTYKITFVIPISEGGSLSSEEYIKQSVQHTQVHEVSR